MRRAFTLVELVVALALGGVAFGTFTAVVAHQERTYARLAHRIHARAQALEGLAPLVHELRAVSTADGDIVAANDSAVEFRATVASLFVCEVQPAGIVTALVSLASAPKPGDTVWALAHDDSMQWLPARVSTVTMIPAGASVGCVIPATAPGTLARGEAPHDRYVLGTDPPAAAMREGAPLRVTRRVRYSLYRAPDAQWYLGRREWSPSLARFETIQPVSGPYHPYAPVGSEQSGLELRYVDTTEQEIASASPRTREIARIDLTIRTRPPPSDEAVRRRRDVTAAAVAPRNKR